MAVTPSPVRRIVRSGSGVIASATTTAGTATTWYQVVASTAAPIYIDAIVTPSYLFSNTNITIDVGTGTAGSEIVVASTVVTVNGSDVVYVGLRPLTIPVRVPTGTRIAVRVSLAGAGSCGVTYFLESAVM